MWVRTDLGGGRTADEQSLLSNRVRRTCALWANDREQFGAKKDSKIPPPKKPIPKPPNKTKNNPTNSRGRPAPVFRFCLPLHRNGTVGTAWSQGQAWAARDWPLLAVSTWCGDTAAHQMKAWGPESDWEVADLTGVLSKLKEHLL